MILHGLNYFYDLFGFLIIVSATTMRIKHESILLLPTRPAFGRPQIFILHKVDPSPTTMLHQSLWDPLIPHKFDHLPCFRHLELLFPQFFGVDTFWR